MQLGAHARGVYLRRIAINQARFFLDHLLHLDVEAPTGILLGDGLRLVTPAAVAAADADTRDAVFVHLAPGVADDLVDFAHGAGEGVGIAFDADGASGVPGRAQQRRLVEAHDHAGQIVGAEAGERVVDELLGGCDGIELIAHQVDGFLIRADVP